MTATLMKTDVGNEFTEEVIASRTDRRTISGLFFNQIFMCRICENTGIEQRYEIQTVRRTPINSALGVPITATRERSISYFCKTCGIEHPELENLVVLPNYSL